VSLKEARVKAVMPGKGGKQIDTTIPPAISGAPLLDLQGRVVAMASQSRHVVIPVRWTEPPPVDTSPSQAPSAPSEPSPASEPAAGAAPSPYDRGGVDPTATKRTLPANSPISQEHAERLHKQYRPERKIPADQDP